MGQQSKTLINWPSGRRSADGGGGDQDVEQRAAGKVGEVPVVAATLDVISSASMTNTESIISP